ncbi:MAG: nitroreductase family protein [Anaerolineales bacterium]|nr:MAG: nitroreductase family protein [Anaerolineales bacterium]
MKPQKNAIYEAIEGRRSIRRFEQRPVEPAVLHKMLQAASRAPSAHNRQPWRWVIVQSIDRRVALAQAMAQELARDRSDDGDDPLEIQRDVERSIGRIRQSPIIVVLCLTMEAMDRYPDPDRNQAEYVMAVQSTAMAGQNLMLLAHAEGLGSCWMCAPLFSPQSVHEVFDVPQDWIPQGLILLGYPSTSGRDRVRKPLEEVVQWI